MSTAAAGRPGDAGVVDQDVEAAEVGDRAAHHALDRGLVGDVGESRP
jgi:hypothetical protein